MSTSSSNPSDGWTVKLKTSDEMIDIVVPTIEKAKSLIRQTLPDALIVEREEHAFAVLEKRTLNLLATITKQ